MQDSEMDLWCQTLDDITKGHLDAVPDAMMNTYKRLLTDHMSALATCSWDQLICVLMTSTMVRIAYTIGRAHGSAFGGNGGVV